MPFFVFSVGIAEPPSARSAVHGRRIIARLIVRRHSLTQALHILATVSVCHGSTSQQPFYARWSARSKCWHFSGQRLPVSPESNSFTVQQQLVIAVRQSVRWVRFHNPVTRNQWWLSLELPNVCTVLIFFLAGLLFFAPRARLSLETYRIPRENGLLSQLLIAQVGEMENHSDYPTRLLRT